MAKLTAPQRQALAEYRTIPYVPHFIDGPVLATLERGGTLRQAAMSAGLPIEMLDRLLLWGREGNPTWTPFYREVQQARARAQMPTMDRLKSDAEDGVVSARESYLRAVNPEDFKPEEQDGGGGTAIQINIQKEFEPVLGSPPVPVQVAAGERVLLPRHEDDE